MIDLLDTEAEAAARLMFKRDIVGYLNKLFPVISWGCRVNLDGQPTAIIVAEDISMDHGYFMYIPPTVHEMEASLKHIGAEIMERFEIGSHQDLLDLPRRVNGEALNAARGER